MITLFQYIFTEYLRQRRDTDYYCEWFWQRFNERRRNGR